MLNVMDRVFIDNRMPMETRLVDTSFERSVSHIFIYVYYVFTVFLLSLFSIERYHFPYHVFFLVRAGEARTKEYCERIVKELDYVKDLPPGCRVYQSVVTTMESKEKAVNDPFAGMWAGQATRARQATRQGQETPAQIQRRLTRMGERRFSNKQK